MLIQAPACSREVLQTPLAMPTPLQLLICLDQSTELCCRALPLCCQRTGNAGGLSLLNTGFTALLE